MVWVGVFALGFLAGLIASMAVASLVIGKGKT
jgi:hypothetical protein